MYPYVPHYYWDPGLLERVSSQAQVHLSRFIQLQKRVINTVVLLFRALVNRHLVDECLADAEIESLWERFAPLDEKLRTDEDQFTAGFQSRPMKYHFEAMPENCGVDEFVATWAI